MKNVAVFCSGGGTDFQSIIDANEKERFCNIKVMIASKEGIGAIDRAKAHGIEFLVFDKNDYPDLKTLFSAISDSLKERGIDYIVLAGYLSILDEDFVKEYKNRIINIHPSLIPSFCGMGYYGLKVHKAALDRGVKITGATIHFVDEGADTGKILMQRAVEVLDGDTPESLQQRVLKAEHEMLPLALKNLVNGVYGG